MSPRFGGWNRPLFRFAGIGFGLFAGLVGTLVVLLQSDVPRRLPQLPDSQEGQSLIAMPAVPPQHVALALSVTSLQLEPPAGGTDRKELRLTATGNAAVPVQTPRSLSRLLRLDGTCMQVTSLLPGTSCGLGIASGSDIRLETSVRIDHDGLLPASELAVRVEPPAAAPQEPSPSVRGPSEIQRYAAWRLSGSGGDRPAVLDPSARWAQSADDEPAQYPATFQPRSIPSARFTGPVDRSRIVTQDRIIKAVLQTPILSSAPGRALALISRPVRSVDTGAVLLPSGTVVLGVSQGGAARSGVIWQRMLLPDGASVALDGAVAADRMGRPGLPTEEYSRFWERFGSAIATSAVNFAATGYLAGNRPAQITENPLGTSRSENPRQEAARQLRQDIAEISRQLVREGAGEGPVGIVAGGTEIEIVLSQDLYLPATGPAPLRHREAGP